MWKGSPPLLPLACKGSIFVFLTLALQLFLFFLITFARASQEAGEKTKIASSRHRRSFKKQKIFCASRKGSIFKKLRAKVKNKNKKRR
jgi:hypothetical protein